MALIQATDVYIRALEEIETTKKCFFEFIDSANFEHCHELLELAHLWNHNHHAGNDYYFSMKDLHTKIIDTIPVNTPSFQKWEKYISSSVHMRGLLVNMNYLISVEMSRIKRHHIRIM